MEHVPTKEEVIAPDRRQWHPVDGNRIRLVATPAERLDALTAMLDQARYSLKIFFYMFEEDRVGQLILDKLVEACQRGVAVELILDSFGSNGTSRSFFGPLAEAGGRFAFFSPRFSTSYFVRNHQKMVIVDDNHAMIGGFNIAEQYFDMDAENEKDIDRSDYWEDVGLEIAGTQVSALADYYSLLARWVYRDNGNVRSLRKLVKEWRAGEGPFRWLLGGPSNRLSQWAHSIKNDLENARQCELAAAYFSPGQGLLRRIARVAKRGGTSRLVLPGRTDNGATIGASRLLYGYLLRRNTAIFEFQPKRLHAKMVVVDDAVYIGSANFDLRSLFINVEMMLRVEDAGFAATARAHIDQLSRQSDAITLEKHRSRQSWLNRLRWTLSYFVVNTLDYTVTRRLNFGIKK